MKPAVLIASLFTVLTASTAQADFIGANAEYGIFLPETSFSKSGADYNYDDETGSYFSIDVQHPIPLIPNLRFDSVSYDTKGKDNTGASSTLDVSAQDITGYYGIGLLWVGIEGGLTVRSLDIDYTSAGTGFSESSSAIPLVYLGAHVEIPGTSITLAAESKRLSLDSDISVSDDIIKIGFQPLPIVGVEAGYRSITHEIKSVVLDSSGYFVGVTIDI
jgi:outer membrane protein